MVDAAATLGLPCGVLLAGRWRPRLVGSRRQASGIDWIHLAGTGAGPAAGREGRDAPRRRHARRAARTPARPDEPARRRRRGRGSAATAARFTRRYAAGALHDPGATKGPVLVGSGLGLAPPTPACCRTTASRASSSSGGVDALRSFVNAVEAL